MLLSSGECKQILEQKLPERCLLWRISFELQILLAGALLKLSKTVATKFVLILAMTNDANSESDAVYILLVQNTIHGLRAILLTIDLDVIRLLVLSSFRPPLRPDLLLIREILLLLWFNFLDPLLQNLLECQLLNTP